MYESMWKYMVKSDRVYLTSSVEEAVAEGERKGGSKVGDFSSRLIFWERNGAVKRVSFGLNLGLSSF